MDQRELDFAKFEAMGEAEVRGGIDSGRISGRKERHGREWLALRDAESAAHLASLAASDRQSLKMTHASQKWISIFAIISASLIALLPLIVSWLRAK